MGLLPQEGGWGVGICVGGGGVGMECVGDAEEGYVRNRFGLPGVDEGLCAGGFVGGEVLREEAERKRRVEREGEEAQTRKRVERLKGAKAKRVNWNKPFFNGVSGTPPEEGREERGAAAGQAKGARGVGGRVGDAEGGRSAQDIVGLGARVRRRYGARPFPSQRKV
ncbi:hypothetical protein T440DRAFT_488919 [Plenodomus tracheiphilus IPT5]|uniref:Uncharacterized protein n=1 Tax=Plenodomus tracheiphilus IPT5 TaxID=1408161 RepID=A0A6A7B8P4_9PLEO|nr:hypothetical protein T440DRAFT_488919 [Plenodomus tracheiphilus IPT5]